MIPGFSDIGLKEWSVTIDALSEGQQIILLRKGGIREDGRHFKIEHRGFFLYPGHFHEGSALLKPQHQHLLNGKDPADFDDMVTLSVYAEITDVIEISDEASVRALDRFHIWSEDYAVKRANWKPRHPLNVILLRCHRLQQPQALMVMPEYGGCKSWVQFVEEYPVGVTTPALTQRRFDALSAEIKDALATAKAGV